MVDLTMKGWKSTDDSKFPYYYPSTAPHYSNKNRRSIYHHNPHYYNRNNFEHLNMTQLQYVSPNGKYILNNFLAIIFFSRPFSVNTEGAL